MTTGAGIIVVLIVAGVILLDVFLLGKHFDRRIDALESDRDRHRE